MCVRVAPGASYDGSTTDMKRRYTKHKCGICNDSHLGKYQRLEMKAHISRLEVTLVDSCEEEKDLNRLEDKWICNMGTLIVEA